MEFLLIFTAGEDLFEFRGLGAGVQIELGRVLLLPPAGSPLVS